MNILSIQSQVVAGHVGNAAAVFPLQRLGHEVWPVATAALSNHPAHGQATGKSVPAADVADLVAGLDRRGLLAGCDAVLWGYVGAVATVPVIVDAVARVRAQSPDALYFCDPVMGHETGLFVTPDVAAAIQDTLVPVADVVFPNSFEIEVLTGGPATTMDQALDACSRIRAKGPGVVVYTSLKRIEGAQHRMETLGVGESGAWVVETPRLAGPLYGAGDLFAALFTGHYLRARNLADALSRAVSSAFGILDATGSALDLALIGAQDEIAAPTNRFEARRIA